MPCVLIVDDDVFARKMLETTFRREGFEVHQLDAISGRFFDVFNRVKPDLILMDVQMPGMTGAKFTEMLRERGIAGDTAIVLHSACREADLAVMTRECGARGYIHKSLQPMKVIDRVRDILKRK